MRGFFVWLAFAVAAVSVTVLAQDPIRSPTNDYFTPRPTFTPATTFVSATNGQPTMISGVGPAVAPSSYTWNYTKPTQTVPAPGNQTLSQSLIKAGYGPSVSQLLPSGNGVQVCIRPIIGSSNLPDTDWRGWSLGNQGAKCSSPLHDCPGSPWPRHPVKYNKYPSLFVL